MGSQIGEAEDDGHGCASPPLSVIVVPRSVQTWVGALTCHQRARYRPRYGSYTMPLTMLPLLQPSDRTTTISSSFSTRVSQVDLYCTTKGRHLMKNMCKNRICTRKSTVFGHRRTWEMSFLRGLGVRSTSPPLPPPLS